MNYYTDDGIWAFDQHGNRYDLFDLIARGIDVVGAATSDSPYVSPNDPRYQNRNGGWFPSNYPAQGYPSGAPNAPVSFNPQGFNMPWWALLGLGLLAGSFLLGKRR